MARRSPTLALPGLEAEEADRRAELMRSRPAKGDAVERAKRAYEIMRDRMLPSLAPYARARTRNSKLKVELTAGNPRTDGKTIWLRPDIRLGDMINHVKSQCGLRDSFDMQLCPACAVREGVFATIAHEVSHMVEGSFATIDPSDSKRLTEIMERAEAECASEPRKLAMRKRFEAKRPLNYAEAANMISPWLLLVINGIEDARVNTAAYKAGPGLYKIFRADLNAVLRDGIHLDTGEVVHWRDQPIEAQICCALYVKLSGMADYKEFFCDEVVELLDTDLVLKRHINFFRHIRSVEGVYEMGVKVLERLRELGYMRRREEDAEEEEAERELRIAVLVDEDEAGEDGASEGDGEKPDMIIDLRTKKPERKPKDEESEDKSGGEGSPDGDTAPEADGDDDESDPSTHGSKMRARGGADASHGKGSDSSDDDGSEEPSGAPSRSSFLDGDSDDDEEYDEGDGDDTSGDDDFDDDDRDDEDSDFDDDAFDDDDDFGDGGRGKREDAHADLFDADDDSYNPYKDVPVIGIEELDIDFAKRLLEKIGRHDGDTGATADEETELSRAVSQGDWIDDATSGIFAVRFIVPKRGDYHSYGDVEPDTAAISGASFRTRAIFTENRKAAMDRNLRTGKINTRVLGRRAPVADDRLFQKRRVPSEKSYFVLIGLDLSGSTSGSISTMIKTAGYNQAELLSAAGIPFAMYGHTGSNSGHSGAYNLDIFVIKEPSDRWDDAAKAKLNAVTSSSANLDGHTLEVYRKVIERQRADRKIIMYYTDGAMPCENYADELKVLVREIEYCKRHSIEVVGVGVRNDDPTKYGLETVRIDSSDELTKVLDELERKIQGGA
jgi:hypothetical protein